MTDASPNTTGADGLAGDGDAHASCIDGNRRRAAEELGIGKRTLYRKIKKYGIPL